MQECWIFIILFATIQCLAADNTGTQVTRETFGISFNSTRGSRVYMQPPNVEVSMLDFSLLAPRDTPLDQSQQNILNSVQEEVLEANGGVVGISSLLQVDLYEYGIANTTIEPTEFFARAPTIFTTTPGQSSDIPKECLDDEEIIVQIEVAGGVIVPSSRFPYMVSIQKLDTREGTFTHQCGGTLLTNKFIMTAAHCIYTGIENITLNDYRLDKSQIYGNISVGSNIFAARAPKCRHLEGPDGRIRVVKYFMHPDYTGIALQGADVAILEVETPFDYDGPFIKVWPQISQQANSDVKVVTGWGATNTDESINVNLFKNSYQQLRMGILEQMDTKSCQSVVGKFQPFLGKQIDEKVICFNNRGVDGCRADSGGPLLQLGSIFLNDDPANDVQLGIVSWGPDKTCTGADSLPGIYTNISIYASWIQTIITQNSEPPPTCTGKLIIFSEPSGDVLLSGYDNPQSSAKGCCESCTALTGCNAWVYCYYKDGCQRKDGSTVSKGFCELKKFVGEAQLDSSKGITVWGGYREVQIL